MTVPPITQQPRITPEEIAELGNATDALLDADLALKAVQRKLSTLYEIREGDSIDRFGYITRRPS